MLKSAARKKIDWDRLGIGLSGVCLVHCLLYLILAGVMPIWLSSPELHAWLHPLLLVLVLPIALSSFYRGNDPAGPYLLAGGSIILLLSWMLHSVLGPQGELAFTSLGSVIIATGHLRNRAHCRHHAGLQAIAKKIMNEKH